MFLRHSILGLVMFGVSLGAPAKELSFSHDVLPILSDNCFKCHGPDVAGLQGELRLDLHETALGKGKSGAVAVVPGNADASEVLKRLLSTNPEKVMPPPKSLRTLKPEQIATLRRWINEGAKWGKHWAYEVPIRPVVPEISNSKSQIANPVDAFVRALLVEKKMEPSPEADRGTLLRRVTLDLTGLSPTLAELDAFLADQSPDAFEKAVDWLIASSAYGERWCWDWLDASRYADSNGFQGDPDRTMWPWRDWVTSAINSNMPYDRFTVEQLAGDLLTNATPEQIIATGFNRNHMYNGEGGRIAEETRVENVFDRTETVGTVFLGLTVGCARCHDHKFDPITHRDYFALYDMFNQTSEAGGNGDGQRPPVFDLSNDADRAAAKAAAEEVTKLSKELFELEKKVFPTDANGKRDTSPNAQKIPGSPFASLSQQPEKRYLPSFEEVIPVLKDSEPEYIATLEKFLKAVEVRDATKLKQAKVMVMDQIAKPRDTFVLAKGAYDKPTTNKVFGAIPAVLTTKPQTNRASRLDLARWIVSPENPLTARVTVNRFWQSFFGIGLVKTAEDFGVQGERPRHHELLDWLATEFVRTGWDVKALHKTIVMSATYRQSSKVTPANWERDPENRLLARGPRFRLPSWMLRDQALATGGLLVNKIGGPGVRPYQPSGIWEEATFGKTKYEQDHGAGLYRRTIYTFWRRIVGPTMLFDNAARQVCEVKNKRTNTPLQALTTLNDVTYVEAARALAQRVMTAAPTDEARIESAFRIATCRTPTADESAILRARLDALKKTYAADAKATTELLAHGESKRDVKLNPTEHAAFTQLCSLILNLDETVTKQ